MSVIAWDGKVVAADRQANDQDMRILCKKLSVVKKTGDIIGTIGDFDIGLGLERWYRAGAEPKKFPRHKDEATKLIVITKAGRAMEYSTGPNATPIEEPFMAWGAGRDVAIGALAMGANAKKAVQVASRYITSCGMGVTSYRIGSK